MTDEARDTSTHLTPQFHLLASKPETHRKSGAGAMFLSTVFHGAIVALLIWATLAVGEEVEEDDDEQVTFIEVAEDVPPPPPPPPPEPNAPPPPMADVPQGFQVLATPVIVPPDIPPPGEAVSEEDFSGQGIEGGRAEGLATGPVVEEGTGAGSESFAFTPYTVKPRCTARCDADDILSFIPALLKRSGVSCELTVGIRIDTRGAVTATDLLRPSGNAACDQAAQQWARATRWTTAYNRDQAVTVWVAQPVTITTTQ